MDRQRPVPDEAVHRPHGPHGQKAPTPDAEAQLPNQVLSELFGGQNGQRQMLARMGTHLSIAGESFLVGMDLDGVRRWFACSESEFKPLGNGKVQIRLPDTDVPIEVSTDEAVMIRIWRQHPRRAFFADSPVLSLRQPLRELIGLSQHITAGIDSRLAGAGVLAIPESASMPTPAASEGINPLHQDPFTAALIEAMVTPLTNRDSAAAVVPIVSSATWVCSSDGRSNVLATTSPRNTWRFMSVTSSGRSSTSSTMRWTSGLFRSIA